MQKDELELIQAGADRELDEAGRARLDALLAGSVAAREHYDDMLRLNAFLDGVPSVNPPETLHRRIVSAIPLPKPADRKLHEIMDFLPGLLRYGLAAGVAVVVTMAVYQGGSQLNSVDYDRLVGTISGQGEELDRFDFSQPGARGSVRLLERGDTYALEFDLKAGEPLSFDVNFAGSGLRFDAFAQADLNLEAMAFTKTTLSARTGGSQRFVVLMRPDASADSANSPIELVLSRDAQVLGRGVLRAGRDK